MNYKDCVNEIKQRLNHIELPYESYTKFEKRKQSDQSINKAILDFTKGYIEKFLEIQNIVLKAQILNFWSDIDALVLELKNLSNYINDNNYEESSFFSSFKNVREIFNIIVESELAILDITSEIESNFLSFKEAFDSELVPNSRETIDIDNTSESEASFLWFKEVFDNKLFTNSKTIIEIIIKLLKQITILWKIRMEAILKFNY